MKRHDALKPLSREHHAALILSQLLKKKAPAYKDLPTTPAEKAAYALEMYNSILKDHFFEEEKILDKVKIFNSEIEKLTREIIEEHNQLATGFIGLAINNNPEEALDKIGVALEKHIRKEERVLFPLIQKYCPDDILKTFIKS